MRILRSALIPTCLLVLAAAACGGEEAPPPKAPEPAMATPPPPPAAKDIVDTAASAGKFNTLATALDKAGLTETLKGPGPYTVFAPTDDAFAKVPKEQLDALLANKDKLTTVLTYHVVPGKYLASDVAKMTNAKTVSGKDLTVKTEGSSVRIGNATVTQTDIVASNGVIHVIDTVLMPEEKKAEPSKPDLTKVAADKKLTTLADLLTKAGLVETLQGPGPFTVFAPTDDAFKKVPKKTLDELGKDTEKLKNVLTYHVVPGKVTAAEVGKMSTAKTVQGGDVKIKADPKGNVMLDGKAKVVEADIEAGNGVLHIIDTVLTPPPAPKGAKPAAPAAAGTKPGGTGAGPGASDHKGGGGGKGDGKGTGGGGGKGTGGGGGDKK